MTTILAKKGQIVIPKPIRDELGLEAGDDFDIYLQDGEIVLRPLQKGRNQGLSRILLHPPGSLEIGDRDGELPASIDFSE